MSDNAARIAAARLWAATKFPYLASALFAADVIERDGIGTIAADEAWRLYVDPAVVAAWRVDELGSVFVHHASHLLRDHAGRARAIGVERDDQQRWVDAADAEINDDLVESGLDLPGGALLPEHLGHRRARFAEEYFTPVEHRHSDKCRDCGSVADGLQREYETGGACDRERLRLLRCRVAADCERCGREPGVVPGGWLRWAHDVLGSRVDWRRVLASEIRRAITAVAGAVDYTYRRPSRRASLVAPVILPALVRPVPQVAVVIDTSGSMYDELLAQALAEVESLLRAIGMRGDGLRVLSCDVTPSRAQRISSTRSIELVGGGGTDMGNGIEAAAALRPRPQIVVVLTDGLTPWPSRPPRGVRVVIGLLGVHHGTAPPWARSVLIDDVA